MGWLILAAAVLALFAGLCASADTALARVSRAGAKELATSGREASAPLQAVLAEVPKYVAVLLLARVAAELAATLLVTWVLLLHWSGPTWRPFLVAGAIMTVVVYVVAGIVPRTLGRRYAASVADKAASVMQPIVRLMGPIPALLLATGGSRGGGGKEGGPSGGGGVPRGLCTLRERRRGTDPGKRAMTHWVF